MLLTTHHPISGRANKPESDDEPGDTRPYLCIPYWETPLSPGQPVDIGQARSSPPPGVVTWECDGIHTSPYVPGKELQVTIDVRNSGHGNATPTATVVVYWANPTAGFAKPSFFAATLVAAPPMRDPLTPGFVSATLSATIPATAPDHICLLACVTHSFDEAKAIANPFYDRHWAQRNLFAVSAKTSPIIVPFFAANPFDTEGLFDLQVRALDRLTLELFARHRKLEPSQLQPKLQLLDEAGRPMTDWIKEAQTRLELKPYGQRQYSLMLALDQQLMPHQITVLEVVLYQAKDQDQQIPVGSLGITVRGDESEP